MKKILFLILLGLCFACSAIAQPPLILDTFNYRIYFFDDFNYPVSIPTYGYDLMTSTVTATSATANTTVVGQKFSDNWTIKNNHVEPSKYEMFYYNNVEVSAPGVLQIDLSPIPTYTVTIDGNTDTINAYGGWFMSNAAYGYGIFEAKFRTSIPASDGASAAFWIGPSPGPTEIDVPDLINDNGGNFGVGNWAADGPAIEGRRVSSVNPFHGTFSDDFHIFSCRWTPSDVAFYVDRNFILDVPYTNIRTFANSDLFYSTALGYPTYNLFEYGLEAVLWGFNPTSDVWVDFDWIKVWKPICNPDVNLTTCTYADIGFEPPYIATDLSRNNRILLNVTDPACSPIHPSSYAPATILEAASTTLLPNFLADQSVPFYTTKHVSTPNGDSLASLLYNGYFEIIPIACDTDNRYYRVRDTTIHPNTMNANMLTNNSIAQSTKNTIDSFGSLQPNIAIASTNKIQIYPNPTQNNVTISYPCNSSGELDIIIKDVSGRILYAESVNCFSGSNAQQFVDMSAFASGVYFLDLTMIDQHVVKKVVKL